jgi:hypothetical protein
MNITERLRIVNYKNQYGYLPKPCVFYRVTAWALTTEKNDEEGNTQRKISRRPSDSFEMTGVVLS